MPAENDNGGVRTNIVRLLNHAYLAGAGKRVLLRVDQGFEQGPARSFAVDPTGYEPEYHF